MRKLGLMVGLALVAIACATGADMVGEMMDSGVPDADASTGMNGSGGTDGNGMATGGSGGGEVYSYVVPCDQTAVTEINYYSTERVDGETVRGQLRYTYKLTRYYSRTEVENVEDVSIVSCDSDSGWSPPQPTGGSTPSSETISNDPYPTSDCNVIHYANYTGNRVLTTCQSVTEYDYNEANPDNDPSDWGESDRVFTSGAATVTITGTPVIE